MNTSFFIKNTIISNFRLKLAKNQANAKQRPEAELLPFENYLHSLCENDRTYSRKQAKEQVCLYSFDYAIIKMKMKIKNRSHRHDINRPSSAISSPEQFLKDSPGTA